MTLHFRPCKFIRKDAIFKAILAYFSLKESLIVSQKSHWFVGVVLNL